MKKLLMIFLGFGIITLIWWKVPSEEQKQEVDSVAVVENFTEIEEQSFKAEEQELVEKKIEETIRKKIDPSKLKEPDFEALKKHTEKMKLTNMQEYYEEVTSGWDSEVAILFTQKLGLGQDELSAYYDLKNKYEAERLKLYREYHESKLAEMGDEYRYDQFSEEILSAVKELNQEYSEALQDKIGEDHHGALVKARNEYNHEINLKYEGSIGPKVTIDF